MIRQLDYEWVRFEGHQLEERGDGVHVNVISQRNQRARNLWVPKRFMRGGATYVELPRWLAGKQHLLREYA